MKLVLAQGNPGNEYTKTRHNIGFMALDEFAATNNVNFQTKSKFFADIAELSVAGEKILLVEPTTYYNETGRAARALADFYKIDPQDILVVHDDKALPFGTLRTREKGSDAGNNGVKSLNSHLGEQYARIRIGIANDLSQRIPATDFVLGNFTADEMAKLQKDILPKISELINNFCQSNHTSTSHVL